MKMATKEVLGFVGLGGMGLAMARNLQDVISSGGAAEPELHVHNRTKSKAESLWSLGSSWCDSPAELAAKCTITLAMLADDTALEAVFSSFTKGSPKAGSVFVDCSTVYPATTAKLAAAAQHSGITYLSCPVFGRPDAAAARKLVVVMAGPAEGKSRVRPYLERIGRAVIDVGDEPRLGSVMKLVGNSSILSAIECISESMTLGDRNGLARDDLLSFFGLMFPGQIYDGYAKKIAADQFEMTEQTPGFKVRLGIKDGGHMKRLADESKVPMPVIEAALSHLKEADAKGRGDMDWTALATVLREKAQG